VIGRVDRVVGLGLVSMKTVVGVKAGVCTGFTPLVCSGSVVIGFDMDHREVPVKRKIRAHPATIASRMILTRM
jgi:hypothetical protein